MIEDWTVAPPGSLVLLRVPDSTSEWEARENLGRLRTVAPADVTVVVIASDVGVEVLDEAQMGRLGWQRAKSPDEAAG